MTGSRAGTGARAWRGRVFIGVSLDGYIARPDGDIEWLTDPPESEHARPTSDEPALEWETFYPAIDHLVMGRGTYEKVLTFGEWPYADKAVVVVSSTLPDNDPRVTVVRDLDSTLAVLADRGARQVYLDGGRLVQSALRRDLVDELTVAFAPVLIGQGLALFGSLHRDVWLRLRGTHASGTGMVHATYDVVRSS